MNVEFTAVDAQLQEMIDTVLSAAERQLNFPKKTINISIIDKETMTELNASFGGSEEPTDVLAFDYNEDDQNPDINGEIVICEDIARAQAKTAATSYENEIVLLALHGLLHLYGYDHDDVHKREKMDALQKEILEAHGYTYRDFAWK